VTQPAKAHVLKGSSGDSFDLGVVQMRLLATSKQTDGTFSLGEFFGAEGRWTVPHVHKQTHESFFVLEGAFTFSLGTEEIEAKAGTYILVPLGLPHVITALPGGGRFLTMWSPAGLEEMFVRLSQLAADGLRDPAVRVELSRTFDSVPV